MLMSLLVIGLFTQVKPYLKTSDDLLARRGAVREARSRCVEGAFLVLRRASVPIGRR